MDELRVYSTRPSEEQIARSTLAQHHAAMLGYKLGQVIIQISASTLRFAEAVERTAAIIRDRLMPALRPLARWMRETELERRRVEQRAARLRKRRRQRTGRGYR